MRVKHNKVKKKKTIYVNCAVLYGVNILKQKLRLNLTSKFSKNGFITIEFHDSAFFLYQWYFIPAYWLHTIYSWRNMRLMQMNTRAHSTRSVYKHTVYGKKALKK